MITWWQEQIYFGVQSSYLQKKMQTSSSFSPYIMSRRASPCLEIHAYTPPANPMPKKFGLHLRVMLTVPPSGFLPPAHMACNMHASPGLNLMPAAESHNNASAVASLSIHSCFNCDPFFCWAWQVLTSISTTILRSNPCLNLDLNRQDTWVWERRNHPPPFHSWETEAQTD